MRSEVPNRKVRPYMRVSPGKMCACASAMKSPFLILRSPSLNGYRRWRIGVAADGGHIFAAVDVSRWLDRVGGELQDPERVLAQDGRLRLRGHVEQIDLEKVHGGVMEGAGV